MKMRRVLSAFLAVICVFTSLGLCTLGVSAEGTRPVYATTKESVAQGSSYNTCSVYLDDLTDLSALTVSVHYDAEKISVQSVYNSVTCQVYDSSNKEGCLQFSYIFDGKGSNKKTRLFYFYYKVDGAAETGDTYFDIVVSDAYNAELEVVNVGGSRCPLTITPKTSSQTCTVSSTASVTTAVKEEFTLSYKLSTYRIASGAFQIQYDPELFEVIEVTKGAFLDNKAFDINADLDGAVALSFAGTAYNYKYDLVSVTFRTLKNVTESAEIKLSVTEFYDLDLNPFTCKGYTSTVNIAFDDSYTEDSPAMFLSSAYNKETGKLSVAVKLEQGSCLGAGDFVLHFDAEKLTYVSSEKGFTPTFFNINEKNVANGILKFSIISMSDILDAQTVLILTFDVKHTCQEQVMALEISGSGLTDAMTNAITLNFVGGNAIIPAKHNFSAQGPCTACGEYRAVFAGASLTLEDNIAVNFKVDPAQFEGSEYSEPYVVFTFNGIEFVTKEYTLDSNGRYAFTFSDIAPRMIGDDIVATLYVIEKGEAVACQTRSYSVKEYCYNMLAECEAGGKYADSQNFKTLLVDLLYYGEAAQIYGNYRTDSLVTDALTAVQKGWATAEAPSLSTVQNLTYKTVENPLVTWKAGGLLLEDAVTMRFKLATDSTKGLTVKFYTEDNPAGWIVDESAFVETTGGYYVYFDGLKARQMRTTVYVTVYQNNVEISNTISYSIESYAFAKQNDSSEKLTALLVAMIKYGDAAARYMNDN